MFEWGDQESHRDRDDTVQIGTSLEAGNQQLQHERTEEMAGYSISST